MVLFTPPACPCTRASVEELGRVFSRLRTSPTLVVSVFADALPTDTATWQSNLPENLRRLPVDRFVPDVEGRWSARFGATTSGEVHAYADPETPRFHGGITGSRGHVGDNEGARRLQHILQNKAAAATRAPVFGCALKAELR